MQIHRIEPARACTENLRFDERPQELFKRHAVVVEEPRDGDRRGYQQAEPACGLLADDTAQAEIDASCQTDGQHCANKLTRG